MCEAASFSFYLRERQAFSWRAFGSGLMDFCQRAIALTAGHTFMELERCAFIMPRTSSTSANSVSSTSFPNCHARQKNRNYSVARFEQLRVAKSNQSRVGHCALEAAPTSVRCN